MTDLGKAKQFLGLEIACQDSGAITLGQTKYIQTIINPFGMEDINPAPTPLHDKITLETEPQGDISRYWILPEYRRQFVIRSYSDLS